MLTDRWPTSPADQKRFIDDLRNLTQKLAELLEGARLEEMRKILGDLFGERPAHDVVSDYVKRYGGSSGRGTALICRESGRFRQPA